MLDLPPMEGNRENEVIAIIVIGKWAQMMYLEPSNLEVPYFLTKTACWRKQQFHQQEWGCHQPQIGWKDISTMMIWAIVGTQEVRRWGIIMGSCTYKYESLDTHQRTQCLICIHVQLQTYDISTFTCCNLPTAHFVVIDVDTYSTLGAFLGQFLFHLCWTNPIKRKHNVYDVYQTNHWFFGEFHIKKWDVCPQFVWCIQSRRPAGFPTTR